MLELRRAKTGRVQIIGHRGAMGHAPENTLPSFELGMEQGVDILELDVHLSRDGEIVVIHDATLERTTNGQGYVRELTIAELKQLNAAAHYEGEGFSHASVPTLAEVLEKTHERAALAIEIKAAYVRYPEMEEKLVNLLRQYDAVERTMVISFDHFTLRDVKRLEANVATGPLYLARPVDPVGLMRATRADVMRPHWAYVTEEEVRIAHENGWAIAPWGASEPWMWKLLWAVGVDAMSANHPDRLVEMLAALTAADAD